MGRKILEMCNIKKIFPGGVRACNYVNFDLIEGEIHALLGENGAGKTTLMNILYGLYHQDDGDIFIKGRKVFINSPSDAIKMGIGMIHQHFTLVPSFSVVENIILGLKDKGIRPNFAQISQEILDLSSKFGLKVDSQAKAWQLSVGERQRVEILKLLYREARILIMDEPTAILTPQEIKNFFQILKKMVSDSYSIIFITHKLEEVKEITDRVTVLKKGKVVGTFQTADVSTRELAKSMVGQTMVTSSEKPPVICGEKVLELENVRAKNDKGLEALKGISLQIAGGEVLGIAGVAGNGQRELAEVISGLREIDSGQIIFKGKNITRVSPGNRIKQGLSFIPEDRLGMGIASTLSLKDNLILKRYKDPAFCRSGFCMDEKEITLYSKEKILEYRVSTPGLETAAGLLSGGNIQKLILARELSNEPDLIVAVHPTRGLDISAIEFVYRTLHKEKQKGKAILLIAGDLEEIFALSDRVAVIYEGSLVGELPAEEEYLGEMGMLMAGVSAAGVKGVPLNEDKSCEKNI